MKKVVVFELDERFMNERQLDFDTEMGWLYDSGIEAKETYSIDKDLSHIDALKVLWLERKVAASLQTLKEEGEIQDVTMEMVHRLVKELHDDLESIDQDIHFRVADALNIHV